MRSTAPTDLTTRARIRDAAVSQFGHEGFERASVRAIARVAGVSAALVIHHFGSKEGLREACDRFVLEEFLGKNSELLGENASGSIQRWLADVDQFRPMIDYLTRMLMSGSSASDELFDALVAGTRNMIDEQMAAGIIRPLDDPEIVAVYIAAYGVAPLLLQHQLFRALGADRLDPEIIRRSTLPILDLYTNGLYTDDRFLAAAREALEHMEGTRQ